MSIQTHNPKYHPKNQQTNKKWIVAIHWEVNQQHNDHHNNSYSVNTKCQYEKSKIKLSTSLTTLPPILKYSSHVIIESIVMKNVGTRGAIK